MLYLFIFKEKQIFQRFFLLFVYRSERSGKKVTVRSASARPTEPYPAESTAHLSAVAVTNLSTTPPMTMSAACADQSTTGARNLPASSER